jgi:hypothetical protein
MKPMRALRRLPPRLAFWALAGIALLVSHDATWLAQVGPGESLTALLRHGGHGYWGAASAALTAAGVVGALWAGVRLYRLQRRSTGAAMPGSTRRSRPYLRRVAGAWLRLFGLVAIGFVLQENAEHAVVHGHGLWAGALIGPEYPLAVPVIAAITLMAALLAAAFVTAELILLSRLATTRPPLRAPRSLMRPARRIGVPTGTGWRARTDRGPPLLLESV